MSGGWSVSRKTNQDTTADIQMRDDERDMMHLERQEQIYEVKGLAGGSYIEWSREMKLVT